MRRSLLILPILALLIATLFLLTWCWSSRPVPKRPEAREGLEVMVAGSTQPKDFAIVANSLFYLRVFDRNFSHAHATCEKIENQQDPHARTADAWFAKTDGGSTEIRFRSGFISTTSLLR